MYSDIKTVLNDSGFDFELSSSGDLATTTNYDSQVYCAIFTDARATEQEEALPERRRGWWGNLVNINQDRQLGGKVWLYSQSRNLSQASNEIKNRAFNALEYLVEDGYLKEIKIETVRSFKKLELQIKLITFTNNVNEYLFKIWEGFGG